ncbi:MAG: hypothetical protein HY321_07910 [Armatimonadetes bacterium]|nr:hypothetical protein [Armatimonadota bacterium]
MYLARLRATWQALVLCGIPALFVTFYAAGLEVGIAALSAWLLAWASTLVALRTCAQGASADGRRVQVAWRTVLLTWGIPALLCLATFSVVGIDVKRDGFWLVWLDRAAPNLVGTVSARLGSPRMDAEVRRRLDRLSPRLARATDTHLSGIVQHLSGFWAGLAGVSILTTVAAVVASLAAHVRRLPSSRLRILSSPHSFTVLTWLLSVLAAAWLVGAHTGVWGRLS